MANVGNLNSLLSKLRAREKEALAQSATVIVGFTQNYAVYVHEDMQAYHHVGQAKFLEQPARQLAASFGRTVSDLYRKGRSLLQCLLIVGLRLQRAAQLLCPVDTGALKASAFTRQEK